MSAIIIVAVSVPHTGGASLSAQGTCGWNGMAGTLADAMAAAAREALAKTAIRDDAPVESVSVWRSTA